MISLFLSVYLFMTEQYRGWEIFFFLYGLVYWWMAFKTELVSILHSTKIVLFTITYN